jgi:hypothetical protein
MILIYWIIQSLSYKGPQHLGLALSRKQLLALLAMEITWFSILYLFYYFNQHADTADSFAWRNVFLYFRGVLPLLGLISIDDHFFKFLSNPTWECLLVALILDYLILWMISKYKKRRANTHQKIN